MKQTELLDLTRHLVLMARLGFPLQEALTERSRWIEGDSLARALGRRPRLFSPFYRAMIEAAESSPRPEKVLRDLGQWLEHEQALRAGLRAALVYPVLTLSILLLEVALLLWLAPLNLGLGPLAPWAGVVALGLLVLLNGPWLHVLLPQRLRSSATEAAWCRALAVLLAAEVPLPRAFELGQNLWPASAGMAEQSRDGASLAIVLRSASPLVAWAGEAGERMEDPAAALLYAADQLELQVREDGASLLRRLEPLATVAVGLLTLLVLASFWATFYGQLDSFTNR